MAVVGREEEELATLHELVGSGAGGGSPLVLTGAAGIGKSTLWLAAVDAARERGLRVLVARPAEVEQGLARAALGDPLGACVALAQRSYACDEARGGMSTGRGQLALLGMLDHWSGEPARALERFEALAAEARAAGFSTATAIHLADHVEALLALDRDADARELLDAWEADAVRIGHRRASAEILRCRGLLTAKDNDLSGAIRLLEEAAGLHELAGDPFGRARASSCSASCIGARARRSGRATRLQPLLPASRRSARRAGLRRRGRSSARSAVGRGRKA